MNRFGEKLTDLRTGKNLTVKEISGQVGIPQSRLVELERGVRVPTRGQVDRLETFFQVGQGELVALVE